MIQNSYNPKIAKNVEGGKANLVQNDIISKFSDTSVHFGRVVVLDDLNDEKASLPLEKSDIPYGITVFSNRGVVPIEGGLQYQAGKFMDIMEKGYIHVRPETSVKHGDPVYYRFRQTVVFDETGTLRNDNGAENGIPHAKRLQGAVFHSFAQAGELALVKIAGIFQSSMELSQYETITTISSEIGIDTKTTIFAPPVAAVSTLENGFEGQTKEIINISPEDIVITPSNFLNGTSITLEPQATTTLSFYNGTWILMTQNGTVTVS